MLPNASAINTHWCYNLEKNLLYLSFKDFNQLFVGQTTCTMTKKSRKISILFCCSKYCNVGMAHARHFPRCWSFLGESTGDVFFDLCLNKRLSKQSKRRWFVTPLPSSWRHCNACRTRDSVRSWLAQIQRLISLSLGSFLQTRLGTEWGTSNSLNR